jgi:hypothetical protein
VIETPGGRIYFVADSGYGDGRYFRRARERHGPFRLAILPIGAYEPRWFMGHQHMNPAESVQALIDCGAEIALAHHYGTFQLTDEPIDAPLVALADALKVAGILPERFRALRPGQVWQLQSFPRMVRPHEHRSGYPVPEADCHRSLTDATAAVGRLHDIYGRNTGFLRHHLEAYVRGEPLNSRVRATYPFVRITTTTHSRLDSRLSYGFVSGPGAHQTTVTRPDLFRAYLTEQIGLLIQNHRVAVEIGESDEPIPIHFAYPQETSTSRLISTLAIDRCAISSTRRISQ